MSAGLSLDPAGMASRRNIVPLRAGATETFTQESVDAIEALLPSEQRSHEEVLFDNAADLKITMSRIAMHLGMNWRDSIRRQIDRLLDGSDWEDDSSLINSDTFQTFLRFIVFAKPLRLPSLGVSAGGDLLATWSYGDQRVAVQFFAQDMARVALAKATARGRQIASWLGPVADLVPFVEGFGSRDCFFGVGSPLTVEEPTRRDRTNDETRCG